MNPIIGNSAKERPARSAAWPVLSAVLASTALIAGAIFAANLDDYQKKQAALNAQLATDYYAVAVWANEHKMPNEARDMFERVLHLDPGNKDAAARLGELNAAGKKTKNPKCEIILVNGDNLKADLIMSSMRIQTEAGTLTIPVNEIDFIQIVPEPQSDRVWSDAFTGKGLLGVDAFQAQSKLGVITVSRHDVKSIRIFRPCTACDGTGQTQCRRCGGTGRLSAKNVCPTCKGKGRITCPTCGGTAKITCPLCGGKGSFDGIWGHQRRVPCTKCDGTGKVPCPDCKDGSVECPTCHGKSTGQAGECPVCKGNKVVVCPACAGSGLKPPPRIDIGDAKPAAPKVDATKAGDAGDAPAAPPE